MDCDGGGNNGCHERRSRRFGLGQPLIGAMRLVLIPRCVLMVAGRDRGGCTGVAVGFIRAESHALGRGAHHGEGQQYDERHFGPGHSYRA